MGHAGHGCQTGLELGYVRLERGERRERVGAGKVSGTIFVACSLRALTIVKRLEGIWHAIQRVQTLISETGERASGVAAADGAPLFSGRS
jgi:hypothetical protein